MGDYVQDNGDGTYSAVVGGQQVGQPTDQSSAENAFNQAMGGGGGADYGTSDNYGNTYGVGAIYANGQWNPPNTSGYAGYDTSGQQLPYTPGAGGGPGPNGLYPGVGLYNLPGVGQPGAQPGGLPQNTRTSLLPTIDGPMTADMIRQKLGSLGNPTVAAQAYMITDPNQLLQFYNQVAFQAKQQGIVDQQSQAQQQMTANSGKTQLIQSLIPALTSAFGPGILSEINQVLGQLGLPQIPGASGSDVNPLNLTPAQWDSLPPNVQNEILQGWQARGRDPKDFLAAIDRQRPVGAGASPTGHVQFAGLR